ncbi:natterin-3-like isoform X2 [Ctenocephalides felis]|uniref:natterin-3-like isoform X2 n=1 Tax=Ctenocephalides felis TaxID=7515 RepID=UPI000E6E3178|nr:natterin-3-like isoform X2 [Ctenocephalides felis]
MGDTWLHYNTYGHVPASAVRAGTDVDGAPIYVARAHHNGDLLPAKAIPDKQVAYVCHGGQEHAKHDYEILHQPVYMWEPCSNGEVPFGAVEVGHTSDGEKLFMGRCVHDGAQTPGKVQVSHGCLYIPYNGEEVRVCDYEVLVRK